MKWILKAIGKHWWAVVGLCLLSSALSLCGVVETLAMRNFIDQASAGSREGFILGFVLYLSLILFQLAGGAANSLLGTSTALHIYNGLRSRIFDSILTRQYATLRNYRSGDFMQLLSSDCDLVASSAVGLLPSICSIVTQLIGSILCLGMLQGKLVILLLVCFFGMLLAALPLRKIVKKHHTRVMEASGQEKNVLQESLGNLQVIRSFQATSGVEAWAKAAMDHYRKTRFRQACFSQAMGTCSTMALNVAYIIGLVWCGMGMVNGTVTFGTFLAVWQLVGQITGPALSVSGLIPQYYAMTASADRLQKLEDLEPEKIDPSIDWKAMKGNFETIHCESVGFSYENEDREQTKILSDLDFTIHNGDVIAITGESGIGKSTFLKLLLAIYYPTAGTITVQGKEKAALLDAGARDMISYVPQGNFLMSGTIRDAVHFWQGETVDEEKLREACRIAEASDMIENLELGYDAPLGERGAGLSEGQLQRLAIARAIYSGKPVLLLDEATSALDEQTEAKVLQNLQQLHNRTVIIVTHRKAALDICNRIVEMDSGRIREIYGA